MNKMDKEYKITLLKQELERIKQRKKNLLLMGNKLRQMKSLAVYVRDNDLSEEERHRINLTFQKLKRGLFEANGANIIC